MKIPDNTNNDNYFDDANKTDKTLQEQDNDSSKAKINNETNSHDKDESAILASQDTLISQKLFQGDTTFLDFKLSIHNFLMKILLNNIFNYAYRFEISYKRF